MKLLYIIVSDVVSFELLLIGRIDYCFFDFSLYFFTPMIITTMNNKAASIEKIITMPEEH